MPPFSHAIDDRVGPNSLIFGKTVYAYLSVSVVKWNVIFSSPEPKAHG